MLAKRAVEVMGKNPAMSTFYLTVTILGMALVESAVIYGLVLSFSIFGSDSVGLYTSIGAGLAV
jgi:F0F1-type ATP synthase membrane subunit c/vacuolar-type H+-ATPase subunit K